MKSEYLEEIRQAILMLASCEPNSPQWEEVLERLVNLILKARRFFRKNFPICAAILNELKRCLVSHMSENFSDQEKLQEILTGLKLNLNRVEWLADKMAQRRLEQWAIKSSEKILPDVLNMKPEKDGNLTWLDKLALEVQNSDPKSLERKRLWEDVYFCVTLLYKAPRASEAWSTEFKGLWNDRIINSWCYFFHGGIEEWKPDRCSFFGWFRKKTDYLLKDAYREFKRKKEKERETIHALVRLISDKEKSGDERDYLLEIEIADLFEWLQNNKDLQHKLEIIHQRKNPDSNLCSILILRLQGKSWEEVAETLRVRGKAPSFAVRKFFQSNIGKFQDEFDHFEFL
jgi:hypothetical protein